MDSKNLNIRVPDKEKEILDSYCKQEGRTITDVLREFIRSLDEKIVR